MQAGDVDDGGAGRAGVNLVEVETEVRQLLICGGGRGADDAAAAGDEEEHVSHRRAPPSTSSHHGSSLLHSASTLIFFRCLMMCVCLEKGKGRSREFKVRTRYYESKQSLSDRLSG